MKKLTLLLFSCLFFTKAVYSQQNKYHFILPLAEKKLSKSLYSNVEVIDSRYDTTNMGRMWFGIVNDNTGQPPAPSAAQQIKDFVNAAVDTSANKGDILIQIRFFKFTDGIDNPYKYGFCFFRAGFYSKSADGYRKICTIDTTLKFITMNEYFSPKKFYRQCSESLSEVITDILKRPAQSDSIYSLYTILHIDSIEKSRIPVYNVSQYKDGIYKTYNSFKLQAPDYDIESIDTAKDGSITTINGITVKNKKVKYKRKEIYAFINNNIIYLSTKEGYVPTFKISNDFFLTGDIDVPGYTSVGRIAAGYLVSFSTAGSVASLLSGLHNPQTYTKKFEMKLDHIDGLPIKMKEVETEEEKKARFKKETEKTAPVKEAEAPLEIKKEENKTEPQELQPY